jgi:hypothetical protein
MSSVCVKQRLPGRRENATERWLGRRGCALSLWVLFRPVLWECELEDAVRQLFGVAAGREGRRSRERWSMGGLVRSDVLYCAVLCCVAEEGRNDGRARQANRPHQLPRLCSQGTIVVSSNCDHETN